MAYNRITTNDGLPFTQRFREAMNEIMGLRRGSVVPPDAGWGSWPYHKGLRLFALRDAMIQSRSGNGSADAHYALLASLVGTESDGTADANAKARTLFNETDSVCGHITGGSSTRAQIDAALDQLNALTLL